ncbi:transposase [Candidatus Riflebacteria bacterium]
MSLKKSKQQTLGDFEIQKLLDPEHYLVKLARKINWDDISDSFFCYYSSSGRNALSLRMMVGLYILKHMFRASDSYCTDRLRGDLYWMHFCAVNFYALKRNRTYLSPSSMCSFRKRIGKEGMLVLDNLIKEIYLEDKDLIPKIPRK